MLTTKTAPKRVSTATLRRTVPTPSAQDLAFLSENQQIEGFPGNITERVANHRANLEEIVASAKRLGAQIPTEANRQRPPVFPRVKR